MEIYHIFLILINIFFVSSNDIISIPFYKDFPNLNGLSPEEIFSEIKENTLLSEINLGTPSQKILLRLALTDYIFYIGGKNSHFHIKFIETDSETYKKVNDNTIYFMMSNVREGFFASDYFYFNANPDDKKEINFILGTDTDKNNEGGSIGLNIQDVDTKKYERYNFINILKSKGYIKDYYFTIKYNTNDNSNSGNLIIGDLPHNYNNSYNVKYFKDMYISMFTDVLTWNINLDSIYVADNAHSENKKIVGERVYGYFKIEQGIITGTERYREYLLNYFMTENIDKKLCFEVKSVFYVSYYCKKEVDLTKFKSLFIYIKELDYNFELNYKDLFYNNNDGNNYFLVYFNNDYNEEEYSSFFWVLGEPFLKKYNLIFNQETNRIGLYTNMNFGDNNNEEDNFENKSFWSRNKWYIILIIILAIVCAGLGFMIFLYKKVIPKRKKKANELDDEFDYSSKDRYIINY